MAAVFPPVMLAGAESQRQGAAAADCDREETYDGGCATPPPCRSAVQCVGIEWALAQRIE